MKKIIDKIINIEVFRFLVVGGSSTAIDFVVYMILTMKLPVNVAKTISMGISSIYSYFANKKYTFKNKDKTDIKYLVRYYIAFAFNFITNVSVNSMIYQKTQMKVVAFIIATACAMIVNYLLQRYFVFKRNPSVEGERK